MHAVKRHDQSGPNSKLPLHTDQTQHLTVNIHKWCSRLSSSLSIPCIVFFFAADKYLCSSDLFSLSLRDQLHFSHYFWLALVFFFPMTPYFFPLPLHCCLSEKEIQLKCLFDGEIGSVVFHFSFFVLLRLFEVVFPPPSGPLPPSVSVCLFVFPLLGKDVRGLLSDGLLPGCFFFFPRQPNIPASSPAMNTIETISCHKNTHRQTLQLHAFSTWHLTILLLWIVGCLCAPHYNTVNLLSLVNIILGCFYCINNNY